MSIDEIVNYHKKDNDTTTSTSKVKEPSTSYITQTERINFLESQNEELKETLKRENFFMGSAQNLIKSLEEQIEFYKIELKRYREKE